MWDSAEAFFGYQFACFAADAVGFVFYTHKSSLQVLYEFKLPLCKPACFFF